MAVFLQGRPFHPAVPILHRPGMAHYDLLLGALRFAARAHRDQRRKGEDASPFINHPIDVAHILSSIGGVTDPEVLAAAVLHDVLEDTEASPEELEARFGTRVLRLVEEVTDDPSTPWLERKRAQVERAPHLSPGAGVIRLADKIANVFDVLHAPPAGWSVGRRLSYLDWTEEVVSALTGVNPSLEAHYRTLLAGARAGMGDEVESADRVAAGGGEG